MWWQSLVLVMSTDWDGIRAIQGAGNTVFYLSGGCMGADICWATIELRFVCLIVVNNWILKKKSKMVNKGMKMQVILDSISHLSKVYRLDHLLLTSLWGKRCTHGSQQKCRMIRQLWRWTGNVHHNYNYMHISLSPRHPTSGSSSPVKWCVDKVIYCWIVSNNQKRPGDIPNVHLRGKWLNTSWRLSRTE